MAWPDRIADLSSMEQTGGIRAARAAPAAPTVLRPLAGSAGVGHAWDIDPTPLDAGTQSDPGSAAGWHRLERWCGWHAITGGPLTLHANDLVFLQRGSYARLTLVMAAGQPARDVWLAVAWQLKNSTTGDIYTLGRPAFNDAGWRARRSLFLNNVNTQSGDFWLDTTGAGTGAAYDSWADPELGDGCAVKLGALTGAPAASFDRIRLWLRGGGYNATVGPTYKDLHYPATGKPIPAQRLFVIPAVEPLRNTQCE